MQLKLSKRRKAMLNLMLLLFLAFSQQAASDPCLLTGRQIIDPSLLATAPVAYPRPLPPLSKKEWLGRIFDESVSQQLFLPNSRAIDKAIARNWLVPIPHDPIGAN